MVMGAAGPVVAALVALGMRRARHVITRKGEWKPAAVLPLASVVKSDLH